ncbi:hypothetical protein [Streptomyces sp. NPDC048248]|uniref:hypothetical protein n=1 Tax=Streptomyces sp. NPDC048248 TaxID=3365523 RepID=UPI00371E3D64
MRTARTLFASAAITAALAISAPAAYALTTAEDRTPDSTSSSSSDHDKSGKGDHDKSGKHHKGHKHDHDKSRDGRKPHGGMRTGGGALATSLTQDWDQDDYPSGDDREEGWKGDREGGWKGNHDKWKGEHNKSWEGKKPHGGVHTGGGALAMSGSGLAAGSVLLLGGLGAGAYMLRRRNASGAAAA